jgi:hypothetical protein
VALVRDFDRDAVVSRKRITEFLQYEPESFYRNAIEILKTDVESNAAKYLVALLVYGKLLFRALCEPTLDRERAAELARHAQSGDSTMDVKLARELADAGTADSHLGPGMAERLLGIIDGISDGKRILPSLLRMLPTDNPYVRSKVVLMIGRSGRSLAWIEKRLEEADTRVRANAIEAIWGIDTAGARELLQEATRESNNRVVGNALVGLYRLGEISPLAELIRMAGHDNATFRRTAAWAMGETGDPRFSEILGRMIADGSATVRRSAFAAVRRIRAATAQVSQTEEWRVAVAAGQQDPQTGERRLSVAVIATDGRGNPTVQPVQFLLSEDGQFVWSYRVEEKESPGPLTVLFLFPDQGALRDVKWKRSKDRWSAIPYSLTDSAGAGFWTALGRAVLPGTTSARGERRVIVLAAGEVGGQADDTLIAAVQASRTSIQVVSCVANPALQEFCGRIGGRLVQVKDSSAIEEAVSLAYLNLLARYEIRYQPVSADAFSLKVRVHTPSGWGETSVELRGKPLNSNPSPAAPDSAPVRPMVPSPETA